MSEGLESATYPGFYHYNTLLKSEHKIMSLEHLLTLPVFYSCLKLSATIVEWVAAAIQPQSACLLNIRSQLDKK